MGNEIDFLLDEIRRSCELGEVDQVLILSNNLKIITQSESFSLERLKDDSIEKSFINNDGISYSYIINSLDLLSPLKKASKTN